MGSIKNLQNIIEQLDNSFDSKDVSDEKDVLKVFYEFFKKVFKQLGFTAILVRVEGNNEDYLYYKLQNNETLKTSHVFDILKSELFEISPRLDVMKIAYKVLDDERHQVFVKDSQFEKITFSQALDIDPLSKYLEL